MSMRELEIMKHIKHENIVTFRDCIEKSFLMIFEVDYCDGGDLFTRMTSTGRMDEREASFVFFQLVDGMQYLHSKNIIHRDIKPENILLKENKPYPTIKIADFGMAKISQFGTTACGTTQYAAPEVILSSLSKPKYTKACDVWSIGIILYILLSGTHPFSMDNENLLFKQMKEGVISFKDELWSIVSNEPKHLIEQMIQVKPEERMSLEKVLESEWFEKNMIYWPETRKRGSEHLDVPEAKRTIQKTDEFESELEKTKQLIVDDNIN